MYEIYCAKSKISGKSYVGCTSRGLHKRMWNHKADALNGRYPQRPFLVEIASNGMDSFEWRVLATADTRDEAMRLEELYTVTLRSNHKDFGYNISVGFYQPPEVLAVKAKSLTGIKRSEETKMKVALANIGKKQSLEARQRMSDAQKLRQQKLREQK